MSAQRCICYHRVSTLDQNQRLALDELRQAAAARGMAIVAEIVEVGSGAKNDRPGLLKVLAAARRHETDAVLVWKLDRFGRSSLDLLANLRALEDAGVRFIATSQGIDLKPGGDPMSRLLVTMLAAIAEFERDLIRERTRLGVRKARERGRRLGRPPVKNMPTSAEVITLRNAGASWNTIANALRCSVASARRAAQKGVGRDPTEVVDTAMAAVTLPQPPVWQAGS